MIDFEDTLWLETVIVMIIFTCELCDFIRSEATVIRDCIPALKHADEGWQCFVYCQTDD